MVPWETEVVGESGTRMGSVFPGESPTSIGPSIAVVPIEWSAKGRKREAMVSNTAQRAINYFVEPCTNNNSHDKCLNIM